MKNQFEIKGKMAFQNLGIGFWGIIDENGEKWRPVNLPEDLKTEGKAVSVTVRPAEEDFSIFMWGKPVKIL